MGSMSNDSVFDDSLCDAFSCPVCFDFMTKKIFTCPNGHSFCHVCILKVAKCPICKVKVISRRNINLEKAAKKLHELKQHNLLRSKKNRSERLSSLPSDVETTLIPVLKRKIRRSWGGLDLKFSGTPARSQQTQLSRSSQTSPGSHHSAQTQVNGENPITCPFSNCCYFTKNIWEIKSHLQMVHSSKVNPVKKLFHNQPENSIRVRLSWDVNSTAKTHVLSSGQAYFVIYIMKKSDVGEDKFLLNVLTVSDKTAIYKYSFGTQSQFSMFYQNATQVNWGGIDIPVSQLEREENVFKCKLFISKAASLHEYGE